VDAINRLDEIDPERCRAHARSFSAARMAAAYERVYEALRLEPEAQLVGNVS